MLKLRTIGISDYSVLEARQRIGRIRFADERLPGAMNGARLSAPRLRKSGRSRAEASANLTVMVPVPKRSPVPGTISTVSRRSSGDTPAEAPTWWVATQWRAPASDSSPHKGLGPPP